MERKLYSFNFKWFKFLFYLFFYPKYFITVLLNIKHTYVFYSYE